MSQGQQHAANASLIWNRRGRFFSQAQLPPEPPQSVLLMPSSPVQGMTTELAIMKDDKTAIGSSVVVLKINFLR